MSDFMAGLFSSKTVGDFPIGAKNVIEVNSTDTVDSAFRKLVENKVLSAPVFDPAQNKYLGFFDVADALALIYSVDLIISAIPDSMLKTSTALRLASSGAPGGDGSELLVSAVFDSENADAERVEAGVAWRPVTDASPMSEVLATLAKSARRVPVVDPETGRVVKIISQSHITHVLNEALKDLEASGKPVPAVFDKTPRNSGGFGLRKVLTVDAETQMAKDAFRLIIENGVSAVAVLDEDKKLLSSITTKDIRLFKSMEEAALQRLSAERSKRDEEGSGDGDDGEGAEEIKDKQSTLALMDLSCGDFVSTVEMTATNKGITVVPAIVVTQDAPIRKMISRLALTKKHRVFIVDENRSPIGIVSVSDIAKLLVDA